MVRALMARALGWTAAPGCRSTSNERMPAWTAGSTRSDPPAHHRRSQPAGHDNDAYSFVILKRSKDFQQGVAHLGIEEDPLRTAEGHDGVADAFFCLVAF